MFLLFAVGIYIGNVKRSIYVIISGVLQPEGLMVIMEKVDVPQVTMTPTKPSSFQTPKGLRIRHPLLGYGNALLASCRI